MTRKHYQWLALAVLFLGPLLTGVLGNYLPGRERENPIELEAPPAAPAAPVAIQHTNMPPAPLTTQQTPPASADGIALNASPTLDTSGLAASGADLGVGGPVAPAEPTAAVAMPALAMPATPPPANMVPQFREGPINR